MAAIYDLNRPNPLAAPCDRGKLQAAPGQDPHLPRVQPAHAYRSGGAGRAGGAEAGGGQLCRAVPLLHHRLVLGAGQIRPHGRSGHHVVLPGSRPPHPHRRRRHRAEDPGQSGRHGHPHEAHHLAYPVRLHEDAHRRRFQLVLLHGRRHGKPRGRHDRPPCRHLVADHHELPARRHAHGLLLPADRRHGRPHRRQREQGHEPRGGPHLRAHHHPCEPPVRPCRYAARVQPAALRAASDADRLEAELNHADPHHRHGDVRAAHARHRLVRHEPHCACPGLDWPYMAGTIIALAA